jgi:tetratricopeptide (TPR) repeat protein
MKIGQQLITVAAVVVLTAVSPVIARAQRAADSAIGGVGTRMARADAAYVAGDKDAAERQYAAIVSVDSTQSRAVFRLAQLRQGRDPGAAITLYRRYVALEPQDPWGYIALADVLAARGDDAGALSAYDQAVQIAPAERDVRIGRARLLANAGHTDAAIAEYEQWVAHVPGESKAWRELAVQRRRAGHYTEAIAALQRVQALDARSAADSMVARDIARLRVLSRATVEPLVGGSGDSDGLTTARTAVTVTSALVGAARLFAVGSADRAGDGTFARATQELALGLQYRPLAQFRVELVGGAARADRALVDTSTSATPPAGPGNGRPRIGRPTPAGASSFEIFPVGHARLVWRNPGDAISVDARAVRQLLDASPFLVAQGVLRDEASLSLDLRLVGPIRARAFGRVGTVHNEDETNGRRIVGGALAYVPGPYELTLRAQTLQYDAPTTLAYFAPRHVRTAELTTYLERETARGATIALDLGAGAQQVADWTTAGGSWSPSLRGWTQLIVPLTRSLALGTEIEAYDARVGTETPSLTLPAARWRYGSVSVWLRAAL